jgi:hypothetical protein
MNQKCMVIGVLFIVALLVTYYYETTEGFATRREKAEAIWTWFSNNPSPSYNSFRKAMKGESNIVEYEDVKKLFSSGKLNLKNVETLV